MKNHPIHSRRSVLKLLGTTAAGAPFVTSNLMANPPSQKLRHASFGVGGMGSSDLAHISNCNNVEIAALCDVFDAFVSKRPYKAAWSFEEAVQEIRSQRGQHFDPEIVDAFFGCLPAIRAIVDEHTAQAGEALRLAS